MPDTTCTALQSVLFVIQMVHHKDYILYRLKLQPVLQVTCKHYIVHVTHLDLHEDACEVVCKGNAPECIEDVEGLHPRLARGCGTPSNVAETVVSCTVHSHSSTGKAT